jgi:hypothetical protein
MLERRWILRIYDSVYSIDWTKNLGPRCWNEILPYDIASPGLLSHPMFLLFKHSKVQFLHVDFELKIHSARILDLVCLPFLRYVPAHGCDIQLLDLEDVRVNGRNDFCDRLI